jgi:hypothetical protein
MADIFREVDEDLRRDRLDKLWKQYGPWLLGLAILIVAATAGYQVWQRWQERRAAERTATYTAALETLAQARAGKGDLKAAMAGLHAAGDSLGGAPAALSRLYEAGAAADQGDTAAAVAIYDQLAGSNSVDPLFRDLAQLLAVMAQLDSGDPAQLQARLGPLTAADNPWRYVARELSGLLAVRSGDLAKARGLFESVAQDPTAPQAARARTTELAAFYAESK